MDYINEFELQVNNILENGNKKSEQFLARFPCLI